MKTLAEAYEEFFGLANEAEHILARQKAFMTIDGECWDLEVPTLLHQLVELCASALNTSWDYERRMAAARRVLENGTFQPLKDEGGTESHPDAGSAP